MTKTVCAPVSGNSSGSHKQSASSRLLSENKVGKSRSPASPAGAADVVVAEEMQELLCKLKDLVPYMPRHKKLSKLEIIQHVIDYIFDLQQALDSGCSSGSSSSTTSSVAGPSTFASFRQPLSTLPSV